MSDTVPTPEVLVTTGPLRNIRQLGALLYDDVVVLAQYETEHQVAIVWHRHGDAYRETYQRDRLMSGLWPTYDMGPGLDMLFRDFYGV